MMIQQLSFAPSAISVLLFLAVAFYFLYRYPF